MERMTESTFGVGRNGGSGGDGELLSRPNIANAAATTAIVWQVQGFVPEEDDAFRKTVADYEKASG